ncbi:MAG: glycoside hydrolase family 25 protein [Saprospiraceae bacterium]
MLRLLSTLLFFVFVPNLGDRSGHPELKIQERILRGIDVSHHQKKIDWDGLASTETLDFVFVKATEGHDFVDSLFCQNWEALHRLGIRRGAYHFFRAYGCGDEQASLFLSKVEMVPGDLAPVLDLERLDGIAPEIMVEEAHIWLEIVEEKLGVRPIIYSNLHFYETYLSGHFDEFPVWIARYSDKQPVLSNGKAWSFWQYTDCACISGIDEKEVCMDYFYGTSSQFDKLSVPHKIPAPAIP